MNKAVFSLLLASTILATGCMATRVKRGVTTQVQSSPAGALVFTGDFYLGDTPLAVDKPTNLTIIKPGYAPVIIDSGTNQSIHVTLVPSSPQAYNTFLATGVRFVYRADTGLLKIEPQNRPVRVGSTYIIRDTDRGLDVQYTVTRVAGRLVYLETNLGANIIVPIIRVPEHTQDDEIPIP